MTTLLLIVWVVTIAILALITAVRPVRTKQSAFELHRRGEAERLDRELLLGDIFALRRGIAVLLVMLATVIAWSVWQELGIIVMLVALPVVMVVAYWSVIVRPVMRFYETHERKLLQFVEKWPIIGWVMGSDRQPHHDQHIESEEHLLHLVESAGRVLNEKQQSIIKHGLRWHATTVTSVMTPAKDIVTVAKSDLLGPLVLNDLHTSGYHMFPVIKGTIDNVVGMVDITDLLRIDEIQKSRTAEKAMTPIDVRVGPDTELPVVLEQLLDHPGQFGLVVDADKTIGMVTLGDVLGALLGTRHK